MNSKNMAIIIAVAVIVIAVAGFTWYSFDQDQDEGYRQIEVGDYFLYQASVQDSAYGEATSTYYYREYVFMSDETGLTMITATSGEDYYTYSYYLRYISMIDPVRTGTLEFMGEEVLCDVYEITTDGETWTYWIDQRTGANLMCQSATDEWNYTFELMESSVYGATVSVDVNQQETEVEPGDVVSYLVREYGIDGTTSTDFLTRAVTAVEGDQVTYTVVGTGETHTDPVSYFINADGFRGLEPVGTAYVKNTEYGNIMCDVYLEEDGFDMTYTFVGKDDGVVYLRQEIVGTTVTEYSLAYSSLVVGSGAFDLERVYEPFGYNVTSVVYTIEDGVVTGSYESDREVYIEYADGGLVSTVMVNMEYMDDESGTPYFILGPSEGEPAEGRTINTPWGALECDATTYTDKSGNTVTEYVYDGVVIAVLTEGESSSTYEVYTYRGYDWGRDDPFPSSELRSEVEVGDWCVYYDPSEEIYDPIHIQVTEVSEDGSITVLNNGEEMAWTITGLTKGPGYEDGEYAYTISADLLYGTRYCDVYICASEDGTTYTSYIGQDDGILYALGVERGGVENVYELYWSSYVI